MPAIPLYQQRVSAQGPLGPGPSSPGQGLAALGAAVGEAGVYLNDLNEERALLDATEKLTQARTQWSIGIEEAKRTAQPGAGGFATTMRKSWQKDAGDLIGSAQTARSKAWLKQRLDALQGDLDQHATGFEAGEAARYKAETVDRNVAALSAGLQANPDQYASALEEQLAIVNGLAATPEDRAEAAARVRNTLAPSAVAGWIAKDPSAAAAALADGKSDVPYIRDLSADDRVRLLAGATKAASDKRVDDRAAGVLSAYEQSFRKGAAALAAAAADPALTDDERSALQTRVRSESNLISARRQQEHVDDLVRLERLQASGDKRADGLAATLYDRGVLSELQYAGVVGATERARIADQKKNADAVTLRAAIASGMKFDPKDTDARKAVAGFFTDATMGVAPGTPQYVAAATQLAASTNIVPEPAISWARASLVGGSPTEAAAAADMMSRFRETSASAYGFAVDDTTRVMSADIADAIHAGAAPAVAVENARKNAQRTPAEREAFTSAYKAQKVARGNASALSGLLSGSDRYDPSVFTATPDAPPALQAEFDQAVERYFPLTGGDAEKARARAFEDVQRKWGRSEVNGKPEILPYAPEAMFPGLSAEAVRADVAKSINENGSQIRRLDSATGEIKWTVPAAKDVRLVPTDATARTGGQVWALGTVDEFGAPDFLRAPDGSVLQYRLPVQQDSYAAAREAQQAAAMEAARRGQQNRQESQQLGTEAARQFGEVSPQLRGR